MKLKISKFLLLLTILKSFLIKTTYAIEWEPEVLANITQPNDIIIDTDNYLDRSSPSYSNIFNYIQDIQTKKNFKVFIYYIDAINPRYTYTNIFEKLKDIEKFTNDLAWFVLKGNIEAEQNSLIVLFSITDRQSRIRTGKNVRSYLSDGYAKDYLSEIRTKMRDAQYTEALEALMKNLHWRITGNTFFYDLFDNILILFFVLIVCYGIYYYCCTKNTHSNHEENLLAENTLENIKRISEKNKENPRFLEDNCIICMEEFSELEKNEMKINNDQNKEENKVSNVNKQEVVNYEKLDNKMNDIEKGKRNDYPLTPVYDEYENSKLINDNQQGNINSYKPPSDIILTHEANNQISSTEQDKNFIAILDCGHVFHSECIVSWNKSNNTCPICRKNIDPYGDQNQKGANCILNINDINNYNTHVGVSNSNSDFRFNRRHHTSLIEDLLWVQTRRNPGLSHYHFNTSNGFTWMPPVPTANSSQSLAIFQGTLRVLFGRGSGGGSGRW